MLTRERAIRLLRAKAAELEAWVANAETPEPIDNLAADVALIATLLADHLTDTEAET